MGPIGPIGPVGPSGARVRTIMIPQNITSTTTPTPTSTTAATTAILVATIIQHPDALFVIARFHLQGDDGDAGPLGAEGIQGPEVSR